MRSHGMAWPTRHSSCSTAMQLEIRALSGYRPRSAPIRAPPVRRSLRPGTARWHVWLPALGVTKLRRRAGAFGRAELLQLELRGLLTWNRLEFLTSCHLQSFYCLRR